VPVLKEIRDVTVDLWTMHSNISKATKLISNQTMDIPLLMDPVKLPKIPV
jgi:hypothetical protein